uniref:Uncharacterized protein n=1 Tax=Caenorhabditis japonica TaxID=281687 RepID=A0A8R1IW38_CAEJA
MDFREERRKDIQCDDAITEWSMDLHEERRKDMQCKYYVVYRIEKVFYYRPATSVERAPLNSILHKLVPMVPETKTI